VIRKLFSYAHIPQRRAHLINEFNHNILFPYINYHCPILTTIAPAISPRLLLIAKVRTRKSIPMAV
jgi:hypothetical protein